MTTIGLNRWTPRGPVPVSVEVGTVRRLEATNVGTRVHCTWRLVAHHVDVVEPIGQVVARLQAAGCPIDDWGTHDGVQAETA